MFGSRRPVADQAAADQDAPLLARAGERVRARLDGNVSAYRLRVDGVEIYGVADFFTHEECARLITMIDEVARPSPTYHGKAESGRTSYTGDVDPHDPFIGGLEQRIDALLGMKRSHGEVIQGQRYQPGQQFRAHFDYFDTSAAYWPSEGLRGGQRTWTAMVYLNAVEAGGATEFPKLPLSIPPQPGALLVWNNMGRSGKPNPLTLHAGLPVERGAKYVVTKWYRGRASC